MIMFIFLNNAAPYLGSCIAFLRDMFSSALKSKEPLPVDNLHLIASGFGFMKKLFKCLPRISRFLYPKGLHVFRDCTIKVLAS